MNITFLIGNGFDLNLGLKTRYRQFYDYYIDLPSNNETIRKFKEDLKENLDNWSDLEIELGNYAKNFGKHNEEDFIELLYDIQDSLADYLDEQDSGFSISEEDKRKSINDLLEFEKYLTPREREEFLTFKNPLRNSGVTVNVITFNYTKTFENIYGWNDKPIGLGSRRIGTNTYSDTLTLFEHIHGTTESNMILGVNDILQISNAELRGSLKTTRTLVKTEMNVNAGTMRDERCIKAIENADIICVYGMSLGSTDHFWWNKIGLRVAKSNARVLIFSRVDPLPKRREYISSNIKDQIKKKFLEEVELDDTAKSKIEKQILVCLNSNMFKVTLNYYESEMPMIEA